MTQLAITNQQLEIITLIYQYRFINRIQLQRLMQLNDYKWLNVRLVNLWKRNYIGRIYSTNFSEKSKPAVYYLNAKGVTFLHSVSPQTYPMDQVRIRYTESSRSPSFVATSCLIVDCCIQLLNKQESMAGLSYDVAVKADYIRQGHQYHFLKETGLKPDIIYDKTTRQELISTTVTIMVVMIEATLPRYMLRKRLQDYVRYAEEASWLHDSIGSQLHIHVVCQSKTDSIYCKRRTRLLFDTIGRGDNTAIAFATTAQLKEAGVTGKIWERA